MTKKSILIMTVSIVLIIAAAIGLGVFIANRRVPYKTYTPPKGYILNGEAYKSDTVNDLPEELAYINVTAEGADSRIIPTTGKLVITTAKDCSAELLSKYVTITPLSAMSVTKTADATFEVAPASGKFIPGQVYNVILGDTENPVSSYAFQTENKLCIKSMLPADKVINVPVDTGLEVCFSDSVRNNDFSKYIEVSPKTKGDFILYPDGRTVAFAPSSPLKFDTIYTLTVKPGIVGASGKALEDGREIRFRTAPEKVDDSYLYMMINEGTSIRTMLPGQEENFLINVRSEKFDMRETYTVKMKIDLYAYASYGDALNAIRKVSEAEKKGEVLYPVNGLTLVDTVKDSFNASWYNNYSYTFDSSKYPCGVYLADITASGKSGDAHTQLMIQISPIAPSVSTLNGNMLFWLNHVDGSPVANADISLYPFTHASDWFRFAPVVFGKELNAKTSKDGVAMIPTGDANGALIYVKDGKDELILCQSSAIESEDRDYLTYVYTDRDLYFSNDKVNIFGVITPSSNAPMPDALYLKTGYSNILTPVDLAPDGSFTTSFLIEDFVAYSISYRIVDADGNDYLTGSVRVTTDDKPKYKASLTFDKLFYRYGDTVNVTLNATFFDGTPAPGLDFSFYTQYFKLSKDRAVTDENGEIKLTINTGRITSDYIYSTDPRYIDVSAELFGMDTSYLYLSNNYLYFHSDYCFRTDYTPTERLLLLNKLDTSALMTEEDLRNIPTNTYGEAADGKVNSTLKKYTYVKVKTGTYYDKITKKTYEQYRYDRQVTHIKSETLNFKDGKIVLPTFPYEADSGYYYEITYNDGRTTYKHTIYATENVRPDYSDSTPDRYTLQLSQNKFTVGDSATATYLYGGKPTEGPDLYILTGRDFIDVKVADSYDFTYTKDLIKQGVLYVINFNDAKYVQSSESLVYDYEKNGKLEVTITTDRDTYKPGDTATATVKVPGAVGGSVLIGVVDEACFAMQEQAVRAAEAYFGVYYYPYDLYYSYYVDYYYPAYGYTNITSSPLAIIGGISVYGRATRYGAKYDLETAVAIDAAENAIKTADETGAGRAKNDVYIRSVFADNPVFSVVKLDANGNGTLKFTVPDNITEWRLTAIAASGLESTDPSKIKLGNTATDIICTLPFFISANVCDNYIKGDNISVSASAYGSAVSGNKVTYKAVLYDENGKPISSKQASAKGNAPAWFSFGEVETGIYKVVITGECNKNTDGIESTLAVTDSGIIANVSRDIDVDGLKSISPMTYPVDLVFYSKAYEKQSRILSMTSRGIGTSRSDAIVAKYISLMISDRLYGTDSTEELDKLRKNFANYANNGYISLLEYSEGDIELTAKLLYACPEIFSTSVKSTMIAILENYVSKGDYTDECEFCSALLALSALGEPILDRLYSVAAVAEYYPIDARLYLAAAFAAMGDYPTAYDIYGKVKDAYGSLNEQYGELRINGSDPDTTVHYTALALLTASKVARVDATMLADWLLANRSDVELNTAELATYARYYLPTEKQEPMKLSYRFADGEIITEEITAYRRFYLPLTKSGFDSFEIVSIDDGISIRASYGGSIEDATDNASLSDKIKITKSIDYSGMKNIYMVTLNISGKSTRAYESFDLTDCIPSGARFVSSVGNGYSYKDKSGYRISAGIYNTYGQNIDGWVSVCNPSSDYKKTDRPEYSFDISVSYYIRGAVAGDFVAESAMLHNTATGEYALSDAYRITVNPDSNWKVNKKG